MSLVYDEHYAISTPSSTAFEADRVDLRGLLGVNSTSWCGYGGSE